MESNFHRFSIDTAIAPLAVSLPNFTSIYHKWPKENQKVSLPKYINIATMMTTSSESLKAKDDFLPLMGKPIHVMEGDRLEVSLENNLQTTGLSLHFHGFEMENELIYDGVVGVTQCVVSPMEAFLYNFTVDEVPGTYWYHTHSGPLGIDSYNAIRGPLIVHSRNSSNYAEILGNNGTISDNSIANLNHLLSYGNERILFFSDGSLMTEAYWHIYKMGGLNPPVSKNEDGFTVGTKRFDFGTCNGKLREVVNVVPGETYKFRLLNGGLHFAFRIFIDGFSMTVIAADSEPVEPYHVDEVILHAGERFDVEVTIPIDLQGGERFWIRADTLESITQGYQNGIRAILNVEKKLPFLPKFDGSDIPDPVENIGQSPKRIEDRHTLNCYSAYEQRDTNRNKGSCIPITELKSSIESLQEKNKFAALTSLANIHTVDFEFSPYPLNANFVQIDGGLVLQHENPKRAMLDPSFKNNFHSHPNTAMLNVPTHSSVIIIWRTKSLMDHPIHLHGYKMEILAIHQPIRKKDCSLSKCRLSEAFDTAYNKTAFDAIPRRSSVLKDTFILPAGGAVVTRIFTKEAALWFAHCHLDEHRDDGMAFILNVGNYSSSFNSTLLPKDYPSCDTPFLKTRREHPACDCYINSDAVLGTALTKNHRCSREHLCQHKISQAANLDSYKKSGFRISSHYPISNLMITLINILIIASVSLLFIKASLGKKKENKISLPELCPSEESWRYKLWFRIQNDWPLYRPSCTNTLRVFEVTGLALLTGVLFYDVGNNSTATGLSEKYSLLFFSITLWTFTRMYPAIPNYNSWYRSIQSDCSDSLLDTTIYCISRCFVVVGNEAWWPMIHCFVCYPMAGMFNHISSIIVMGLFLAMNTMCYVSLGGTLGIIFDSVPLGMCTSTIISQTSLVAAGFYTHLPSEVLWIRYISPVFWTYRGILKTALRWTDTFSCVKGQSDVGSNQCYLEFNPGIDALKSRGINVATFNDSRSADVFFEAIMLCILFQALQTIIFLTILWKKRKNEKDLGNTRKLIKDRNSNELFKP